MIGIALFAVACGTFDFSLTIMIPFRHTPNMTPSIDRTRLYADWLHRVKIYNEKRQKRAKNRKKKKKERNILGAKRSITR